MDTKRLYVDFHVLQTVPPSCVNRDDTGSPKTAVYGGAYFIIYFLSLNFHKSFLHSLL